MKLALRAIVIGCFASLNITMLVIVIGILGYNWPFYFSQIIIFFLVSVTIGIIAGLLLALWTSILQIFIHNKNYAYQTTMILAYTASILGISWFVGKIYFWMPPYELFDALFPASVFVVFLMRSKVRALIVEENPS